MKKAKFKSTVVEINVTARDIKNGEPAEPGSCPIALATSRKFKKAEGVYVDKQLEFWCYKPKLDGAHYFKGELPVKARKFIQAFDRSFVFTLSKKLANRLKPFKFKVRLRQVY